MFLKRIQMSEVTTSDQSHPYSDDVYQAEQAQEQSADPETMLAKRMMQICADWEYYTINPEDQRPVGGSFHQNVFNESKLKDRYSRWYMDNQHQWQVETVEANSPMDIIIHSLNASYNMDLLPNSAKDNR